MPVEKTAYERAKWHFATYYRKDIDELHTSETRGYWVDKIECEGKKGGCEAHIHDFLFNEGPCYHTYYFAEPGRDEKGRFLRPYRAWEELRKAEENAR